jgi:thymidine phosphorylase
MRAIIKAQHGSIVHSRDVLLAKMQRQVLATKSGIVRSINNKIITRIARLAGAPADKEAGIELHVHRGVRVRKGQVIFTIHSNNPTKLEFALAETNGAVMING